jgi:hypothetical protein
MRKVRRRHTVCINNIINKLNVLNRIDFNYFARILPRRVASEMIGSEDCEETRMQHERSRRDFVVEKES